ncbi:UNVERIFIED_CONTAM: hypothetical protein GTU68_067156 [Idotea baltica]|nr:hypothetical protein [Idotea baltica]
MTKENIEKTEDKIFECSICNLKEIYHYYGRNPYFNKHISFLEESYVMKDPFKDRSEASFLLLGSKCVACTKPVCQSCSIFYSKRFCLNCAKENNQEFPENIQKKFK